MFECPVKEEASLSVELPGTGSVCGCRLTGAGVAEGMLMAVSHDFYGLRTGKLQDG